MNFIAILVSALVPTVIGFIWYNPKVLGTAWMNASGMTEEKMQGANMAVIFGVSLVLSIMLAMSMAGLSIHQLALDSLLLNQPGFGEQGSELMVWLEGFKETHKNNFRTFPHGLLHGAIAGIFFVLPVLGTNALFERKGIKYIAINVGYWLVTLALMGGIISVWQ